MTDPACQNFRPGHCPDSENGVCMADAPCVYGCDRSQADPAIEAAWLRFRETAVSGGISEDQADDLRIAFYAGAWSMFAAVVYQQADLGTLENECEAFLASALRGEGVGHD